MKYYLGADLGSSKTDILICDETGRVLGVGKAGSGNHQVVGYEGMANALEKGIRQALAEAGIPWPAGDVPTLPDHLIPPYGS